MLRTPVLARRRSVVLGLTLAAVAAVCAVAAAAAPAAAAPPRPYSFLLNYTDQLGVPGFGGGTALTAQSDLYTGYTELSLRLGAGGRSFPSNGRTMEQDRYPILISQRPEGGVLYTLTVFAAPIGSQQVNFARVEALNVGSKTRRARVTAFVRYVGEPIATHRNGRTYRIYRFGRPATPTRPGLYFQPGADFNPLSVYGFAGDALLRDGTVLYDAHAVERGARRTRRLRLDASPANGQTIFGQTEFAAKLKPHESLHVDVRMPVTPVPPVTPQYGRIKHASFNASLRSVIGSWGRVQRGAMRVSVPEPKVVNTFYASLDNILVPRYRLGSTGEWVQAVNLQVFV